MSRLEMLIGDTPVQVEWEENDSVHALEERAGYGDVIVHTEKYGGFEQVGALGFSLPSHDTQIVTDAGDIMLYCGNQIVVFYGSNSWAYTRLGRITDRNRQELKELLGTRNTVITIKTGKEEV